LPVINTETASVVPHARPLSNVAPTLKASLSLTKTQKKT